MEAAYPTIMEVSIVLQHCTFHECLKIVLARQKIFTIFQMTQISDLFSLVFLNNFALIKYSILQKYICLVSKKAYVQVCFQGLHTEYVLRSSKLEKGREWFGEKKVWCGLGKMYHENILRQKIKHKDIQIFPYQKESIIDFGYVLVPVGKIRKQWLKKTVGELGVGTMKALKAYIDPQNIFANNNLMMGNHSKL